MSGNPIKKKNRTLELDSEDVNEELDLEAIESNARSELTIYLEKKGLDPSLSSQYDIVAKPSSKLKIRASDDSFIIQYIGRDHNVFPTRNDVYLDIVKQENGSKKILRPISRSACQTEMNSELCNVIKQLPVTFNGISVISFGNLDPRPEFHTPIKLYPIGYKCKLLVPHCTVSSGKGDKTLINQEVLCEILGMDSPKFIITVLSTHQKFMHSTEAGAWKNV